MADVTLQQRALRIALTQVGVREVPINSNRGPEVEKYLQCVGMQPGNAWCAAFTSWCIWQAGGKAPVTHPHTAWTPAIWEWGKKHGMAFSAEDVQEKLVDAGDWSGALFLIHGNVGNEPMPRVKHVGFVEKLEDGYVHTVEGNTDASGSREGGGVYQNRRALPSIYGFVTYGDYLLTSV